MIDRFIKKIRLPRRRRARGRSKEGRDKVEEENCEMSRYQISMQNAKRLQKWALKISGAYKFLENIPKLPKTKKIKPGLYVSYEINDELDGGIDWPDISIATIYAVLNNNQEFLGEIGAYNFETYWLSTLEDEQIDTAENWWELINEEYKKLLKSKELIK